MRSLALALEQKYPGIQGIGTTEGVLTSWPENVPRPSGAELEQIIADYIEPAPKLSSIDFFALFEAEELAIEVAGETDPNIRIFLRWATGADVISMDNTKVIGGLDYLISKELLTEERKAAILAGQAPA
ncbi:hypothetical protein [Kiloniella antarctica]|uniref:Uncharacterized protein n=1 Tax=Kiloniella antarctica TaxID=1550907 RepID=A0ABW5BL70_9PROT